MSEKAARTGEGDVMALHHHIRFPLLLNARWIASRLRRYMATQT
jgi:hypothetical protein